jgi:acyl dehydratase
MNKPVPVTGYQFAHPFRFEQADVIKFADITGDNNPVHLDSDYAARTPFGKPIMHGFLSGSIFSKVFGTIYPGEGTIYLEQQMIFKRPMFVATDYMAKFIVLEVDPAKASLVVQCSIAGLEGKVCIEGVARLMNNAIFGTATG